MTEAGKSVRVIILSPQVLYWAKRAFNQEEAITPKPKSDLSLIEDLWRELKKHMQAKQSTNLTQLHQFLTSARSKALAGLLCSLPVEHRRQSKEQDERMKEEI